MFYQTDPCKNNLLFKQVDLFDTDVVYCIVTLGGLGKFIYRHKFNYDSQSWFHTALAGRS